LSQGKNFTLSPEEIFRYSRQIVLPEIGVEGQKKIKQSSVLLVGVGGLGSIQALYLAAAGVGRLGLIDGRKVCKSNLHRQVLYSTDDDGMEKVNIAKERIQALNPDVNINVYNEYLNNRNAERIAQDYDYIIDASDNFPTRYRVNALGFFLKKPVVFGSVYRYDGQVMVIDSNKGPCYRCLYPEPPLPCDVQECVIGGVMGSVPGIIGLFQATETIKLIYQVGQVLSGKLLTLNIMDWDLRKINIKKNPDCPVCGSNPTITSFIDYRKFCGIKKIRIPDAQEITPGELKLKFENSHPFTLIDVREFPESEICKFENSIQVPERELKDYSSKLNKEEEIILHCRSGIRSARTLLMLRENGFTKVSHLRGGIIAWIDQIDPSLPRY